MAAITRKQFRDAVSTLLEQQRVATPTLLRKTSRFNRGMAGEKPIAWQSEITSNLEYTIGIRFHVMRQSVQIATTFPADLPTDDFDDLLDALVERFTLNDTIVPVTEIYLTRVDPNEYVASRPDGGADIYRGALLDVELRVQEGRN